MSFQCPHNGGDMPCMRCDNEMLVKDNTQLKVACEFALAVLWGSDGDKRGAVRSLEKALGLRKNARSLMDKQSSNVDPDRASRQLERHLIINRSAATAPSSNAEG